MEVSLRDALALNERLAERFARLKRVVGERIAANDDAIVERRERLAAAVDANRRTGRFANRPFVSCSIGAPYFKDADRYPVPYNADALELAPSAYARPVPRSRLWTERQREALSRVGADDADWETLALDPQLGHDAAECRAMWRLYANPAVDRRPVSAAERDRLRRLVRARGAQDWERIAAELGTSRSAYQCFVYCAVSLNARLNSAPWTDDEDRFLWRAVEQCRVGDHVPWANVAYCFARRTKAQVYNRYSQLAPNRRRGRFTRAEDATLKAAIRAQGADRRGMSRAVPGRSGKQARERLARLRSARSFERESADSRPVRRRRTTKKLPVTAGIDVQLRAYFANEWRARQLDADPEPNTRSLDAALALLGAKPNTSSIAALGAVGALGTESLPECAAHRTYSKLNALVRSSTELETDGTRVGLSRRFPPSYDTLSALSNALMLKFFQSPSTQTNMFDRMRRRESNPPELLLFKRRFDTLFEWPTALTLSPPTDYPLPFDGAGSVSCRREASPETVRHETPLPARSATRKPRLKLDPDDTAVRELRSFFDSTKLVAYDELIGVTDIGKYIEKRTLLSL